MYSFTTFVAFLYFDSERSFFCIESSLYTEIEKYGGPNMNII